MAITQSGDVVPTGIFSPRDVRDPLGVWGVRIAVTGDATGVPITVQMNVSAERKAAYVFTCYNIVATKLSGSTNSNVNLKSRLLTNWPNLSDSAGIQAFGTVRRTLLQFDGSWTGQLYAPADPILDRNDRFILLYDPRPSGGAITIIELQMPENENSATYAFEAYGYYWDRSVMDTPGGPRHPGND